MNALVIKLQDQRSRSRAVEVASFLGLFALFLLGWIFASNFFYGKGHSPLGLFEDVPWAYFDDGFRPFFALGVFTFFLLFFIAYSPFVLPKIISSCFGPCVNSFAPLDGRARNFFRVIALIQAFCAGMVLNILRLHYSSQDSNLVAFKTCLALMSIIIFMTWGVKYLRLRTVMALLPLALFFVGTYVSSRYYHNVEMSKALLKVHRGIAVSFEGMYVGLDAGKFIGVIQLIGLLTFILAYYSSWLYFFLRPLFVLSYWRGAVCGCALNGFIAIMLVIAPFAAARVPAFIDHDTFLSIAEALFIRQTNPITFGTWSWLIGNAISLVPFLLSVLNAQRRREEEAYYYAAPIPSQTAVQEKTPPKMVLPPSEENKKKLLGSLVGQEEALTRLWDSTLFPVLKGDREFGNAILLGPTGVGKTETAKKIAEIFYGGRLLRFDLNQFSTEWEASRLLGSAPGFVGYNEEGGELIRGIRQMAPCVILLDEVEKVHPNLLQVLLQLTGEGYAKDSQGRAASADRSIILMTSNIWPERANELSACSQEKLKKDLKGYITNRFSNIGPVQLFSPEFLGRVNAVVPFKPFSRDAARAIVRAFLLQTASARDIVFKEGSVEALSEHIDVSEGYRGLKNAYEDIVERFLNQTATIPAQAQFGVVRKAGRLVTTLWTASGEKLLNEESRVIVKGYDVDKAKLNDFEHSPLKEIVGQDRPIQEIVDFLRIAVSGALPDTERPMGIFLLAGPTGVGKTETARALSKWLFEGRMIKKDMGEYKHPSDGRRLFGDQYKMGSLTKEVTELGSCVVLFDEIEKAHPEVFDTFLTLFDEGKMGDAATNLRVSFKNTIILMTTNLAPDRTEEDTPLEALTNDERRDLFAYHFRAELLGRINRILVYNELTEEAIEGILRKRVGRILARKEEEGVRIEVSEDIYRHLAQQVRSSRYGVRGADEVIINSVGAAIAGIPEGSDAVSLTLEGDGRIVSEAL